MEVREYLVFKYDGKVERFPVDNGDATQARMRASLCQRPGDRLVLVTTEDAYILAHPQRSEKPTKPDS